MSLANSAAKKRRAPSSMDSAPPARIGPGGTVGARQSAPQFRPGSQPGAPSANDAGARVTGLTLPQVISLIDKRLVALETSAAHTSAAARTAVTSAPLAPIAEQPDSKGVEAYLEEFDRRFDLFAEEIDNLKNIVMNLQTYTMDVNKMLIEERNAARSERDAYGFTKSAMDSFSLNNLSLGEKVAGAVSPADETPEEDGDEEGFSLSAQQS
jgi:hypothetical protein